jgi:hypothetical protein
MLPAWWELGTKVSTAAREADFGGLKEEERAAVGQADGREGGKRRRRAPNRRTVAKGGRPGPRLRQARLGSINVHWPPRTSALSVSTTACLTLSCGGGWGGSAKSVAEEAGVKPDQD